MIVFLSASEYRRRALGGFFLSFLDCKYCSICFFFSPVVRYFSKVKVKKERIYPEACTAPLQITDDSMVLHVLCVVIYLKYTRK